MKRTIRILTLLAVMMVTAGQAWADEPKYAIYSGTVTGGEITFYGTLLENGYLDGIIEEATAGQTVYISASPNFGYTVTGMTFTVEKSVGSGEAQAPRRTPGIGEYIDVTVAESSKPGIYQFTMPSDGSNVTVNAEFKERPYLGDGSNAHINYLTASGETANTANITTEDTKVYIIDGTEYGFGKADETTWFVCNSKVNYDILYSLGFSGDVHLILADGAAMTVENDNGNAIYLSGSTSDENGIGLTIYAQSTGKDMGSLSAICTGNSDAIFVENSYGPASLTINGGKVTANTSETGGSNAISVRAVNDTPYDASITINDGQVIATGGGDGGSGIYAVSDGKDATITINGGQVETTGGNYGIYASSYGEANINLGWKNTTDFIKASSYHIDGKGSMKTVSGKRFIIYDGENYDTYTPATTGAYTFNTPNDIAGKTLRPLDGYIVCTPADITAKETPDFTFTNSETGVTTNNYIFRSDINVTLTTANYGQNGIEFDANYNIADATVEPGEVVTTKTFAMPAQDVSISDVKYYNTAVKYMDWDDTQKKLVEKNTATDENTDNDIVYVLTGGGATKLPEGWYVVTNWNTTTDNDGHSIDAAYTGTLQFKGDAHLILADGCEMSVNNPSGNGIRADEGTFTIYGQKDGNGTLNLNAENGLSASEENVTINGGIINANGSCYGIILNADPLIINGGQVTATGGTTGIDTDYPVTINGGQVTAIGGTENNCYGIRAYPLTLGWTNADDFVMASSYSGGVKVAAGKRFIAYNMATEDDISANCIIGSTAGETTLNSDTRMAIAGKTLRPLAVEETANDGTKTTYPGYYVSDNNTGLAFSGKTTPDFTIDDIPYYIYKANDDVTLTTDKDYGQNGIEFATTPADAIEDATDNPGTVVTTKEITMSAQDIAINDVKYYNTAVKYMDWDNEKKELVSKNTADDNTDDNNKVYILTGGGETTLPGGWYVVNNWNKDAEDGTDAAYTGTLQFTGESHLILADDAEMTVGTEANPIETNAIKGNDASIAIYSQSEGEGMGALTARSYNNAICFLNSDSDADAITINGGKVTAHSNTVIGICAECVNTIATIIINGGEVTAEGCYGIYTYASSGIANITINGGHVEATGKMSAILAYANSSTANFTINGGQVEATGGTGANNYGIQAKANGTANLTLSLTNGSDYITANSYNVGTGSVKIPAGKALAYTDEDDKTIILGGEADYIFGASGNATLASIANQTLRASKNFPVAAGQQYTALYQEQGDWKVTDPNVKLYVPTGNIIKNATTGAYEMGLQEVTGGGIPDGMPVIAGVEDGTLPANIPVVGTSADEANDIEDAYDKAEEDIEQAQGDTEPVLTLIATNTTETLAQQIINAASPKDAQGNITQPVNPSDYIIFSLVNGKLTATSANQTTVPSSAQPVIVVNKFDFLQMIRGTYNATTSSAPGIVIDLGEDITGVREVKEVREVKDNSWYTLEGVKLDKQPAQKGIYINKGKKVVIK